MPTPKALLRDVTKTEPLTALAVAVVLLVGIAGPASAQFFNFGGPPSPQPRSGGGFGGGGWFGGDEFAPFQQRPAAPRRVAPRRVIEDYSRAPPPEKRETVPERNVLVLGDAMADWLAYGLEDAYSEQPDMGVIRKHKTVSGLINYQPRGEPADWVAAAKGILATEKPDTIVVMLGLDDRAAMREPAADKSDRTGEKKNARGKPDTKPADAKTKLDSAPGTVAKPGSRAVDTELPQEGPTAPTPGRWLPERRARVRRMAFMNFATSAGSSFTPRKSKT